MAEPWTEHEVSRAIEIYFAMFELELDGQTYKKVSHYRPLSHEIRRSEGSIERKFSNISAVLAEGGATFIDGYKPLSHIQQLLRRTVEERLEASPDLRRRMIRLAAEPPSQMLSELGETVPIPADLVHPSPVVEGRRAWSVDFSALEAKNRPEG